MQEYSVPVRLTREYIVAWLRDYAARHKPGVWWKWRFAAHPIGMLLWGEVRQVATIYGAPRGRSEAPLVEVWLELDEQHNARRMKIRCNEPLPDGWIAELRKHLAAAVSPERPVPVRAPAAPTRLPAPQVRPDPLQALQQREIDVDRTLRRVEELEAQLDTVIERQRLAREAQQPPGEEECQTEPGEAGQARADEEERLRLEEALRQGLEERARLVEEVGRLRAEADQRRQAEEAERIRAEEEERLQAEAKQRALAEEGERLRAEEDRRQQMEAEKKAARDKQRKARMAPRLAKVKALREGNMTIAQIAEKLGISDTTVNRYLDELGMVVKRGPKKDRKASEDSQPGG